MNTNFVLDSIEAKILPSVKDKPGTTDVLIENIENIRKSLKIIDIINKYNDLQKLPSGYLYSADPIYCSTLVNIKNIGSLGTHVVNNNGDIYVYMFNVVDGINVYTNSPFIFIGNIRNDKFVRSRNLEKDMKNMGLSVAFRKHIKEIINSYEN